ncbi:hypothetical protein MTR_7g035440 [Medicago truncatula]|uniref:RNase H type-1 domain-containing protein n=1 Tax=Medicago truncatula TaxID=3880 RepID=A0A072U8V8_MEDTR|nr:hypothetical protein MTR_7g035440 [Medicago truncatula]
MWFIRNQTRFQDKKFLLKYAINSMIAEVSLIGNKTNLTSAVDMAEFLVLGALAQNLNTNSAFNAEIFGAITAIDIAIEKNWTNLWLETDSKLVTLAFKNKEMVPWSLGNRWLN